MCTFNTSFLNSGVDYRPLKAALAELAKSLWVTASADTAIRTENDVPL